MSRFSQTLTLLRREAGFPTAYAFYHRSGGRRSFPFTFAHYRQLEFGKHLPRPQWLPVLMNLLRLPPADARRRDFVMSFLRTLFVTEEYFQSLVAPLTQEPVRKGPEKNTPNSRPGERTRRLTPEQCAAVAADAASYWAFECLINDRGAWRADDLAEKIGLPEDRIEAALRSLASHKLAKKGADGGYRSALAGTLHAFPYAFPGARKERGKIARYVDEMVAHRGAVLHDSGIMLRAEEGAMRHALTTLRAALEAAATGSALEKAEGSGLVILRIRARKAFGF
jgi:hypothetical protein